MAKEMRIRNLKEDWLTNPRWEGIQRTYSAEEVIGKTPGILQGPKTDEAVLARLASDLSAGRVFHGKAINYRKDGSEFAIEWKVVPAADVQGAVTHFVAVQREAS